MFTKKSHADVKKSTLKIQDTKKDSASKLRHLKTILENVDIDEAKSVFETNYSHVYYVLYDTFIQAETNLRQRELSFHIVHKAHREELDGSLWLLGKILCLLPELIARGWQCHSIGRLMAKLLHPGNGFKLRRDGVRYFLLWYQALGENAPPHVHSMFMELVPGLSVPTRGNSLVLTETEFHATDLMNHPNMRVEIGTSVFHDTGVHPVRPPDIVPLLPPASNERTAAPDPKDGLEVLLDCMVQTVGCLKWRENSLQRHMKSFGFLLNRFREVYLPCFCPGFDKYTSIYDPKLDLPVMRSISKKEELLSQCVVVLIVWIAKFTYDAKRNSRIENFHIDDDGIENVTLSANLKLLGCTQAMIVREVLYSSRENVNFIHEVYRQAFLLNFSSLTQIEAMKCVISVYKEWINKICAPFLLEPEDGVPETITGRGDASTPRNQRLRTDSYIGAITKENHAIRAGLQNVLQVFVTNAANVFMVQTSQSTLIHSRSTELRTTPLNEQIDICKRVLSIYRIMVMNIKMSAKTWEQLFLVLLQITAVILTQVAPNQKKTNLGSRLAQPLFQTLIVTWIRAHINVPVKTALWEKYLSVCTALTHREELIIEWAKTMHILTKVLAKNVYNLNLQDLPLDRINDKKNNRRRFGAGGRQMSTSSGLTHRSSAKDDDRFEEEQSSIDDTREMPVNEVKSIPGTPSLNRSYSEGSLAPYKKSREQRHMKARNKVSSSVQQSLNQMLANQSHGINLSSDALNSSKILQMTPAKGMDRTNQLRRAISLDSMPRFSKLNTDRGSRSPSPTASSGVEGGSIKDSPIQLDVLGGDSSSIDIHYGEGGSDRRSIINGGTATGWMPDVAAIMWRRMLGSLGDINKILNPKLHAMVFKNLVEITINLIKIRLNQGVLKDSQNQPTTNQPNLVPPISLVAPWCYEALELDGQFRESKLYAMELLCSIVRNGPPLSNDHLPLFYNALHTALTGEDRELAYTALKYLGGPRFLSILMPGHTLLLLDLVHASTVILTSKELKAPRAEVIALLGALLCFPKSSLPKTMLQPSETQTTIIECPDLQDHILNVVLRSARHEPTSKARCIALSSLGAWIVHNLSSTSMSPSPRLTEAVQILLQALQFKHRVITRIACESLLLGTELGGRIAKIANLPKMIILALCNALEIQNVPHPKDNDKTVMSSLILCLAELCMSLPLSILLEPIGGEDQFVIGVVLRILHQIATGTQTGRIKLLRPDEDFDMTITLDDVRLKDSSPEHSHSNDSQQNSRATIKLCAKTVILHLVTNLKHFPMEIGASRMSSLVDEQDDFSLQGNGGSGPDSINSLQRDSIDMCTSHVLGATNLQMFLLKSGLLASILELPEMQLPGGCGAAVSLKAAKRQVRIILRDLNGKSCWDASLLFRDSTHQPDETKTVEEDNKQVSFSQMPLEKQQFFLNEKVSYPPTRFRNDRNCGISLDPMHSTMGYMIQTPRHTLRHRPPSQLPLANEQAADLDQLDDLLQYIGFTSPECLDINGIPLNTPKLNKFGADKEAQMISAIANQRGAVHDYIIRHNLNEMQYNNSSDIIRSMSDETKSVGKGESNYRYSRLLFSHLGFSGWEYRKKTHLLNRTEKLVREIKNLDMQKCRETHKMAVIYVAPGQDEKTNILKNTCGSSAYEMFVSALGWEIELETHNGFLGGLPRQGCGTTCPYYATSFVEVIYHVSTRMPSDSADAILTKTRHLGNDEVHIVWSEHYRDYRRDILPTEFCDILIVIYPLKSGLFRVTVNRKPDVPWFGPLTDETVVSGSCLARLVRATAINASRIKRSSLPFYQQYYEERQRSLETVALRHKESTTFEDFISRVFNPNITKSAPQSYLSGRSPVPSAGTPVEQSRSSFKSLSQQSEQRESITHQYQPGMQMHSPGLDPSPRQNRKLHPFKVVQKRSSTPPASPTLPGRKFR